MDYLLLEIYDYIKQLLYYGFFCIYQDSYCHCNIQHIYGMFI